MCHAISTYDSGSAAAADQNARVAILRARQEINVNPQIDPKDTPPETSSRERWGVATGFSSPFWVFVRWMTIAGLVAALVLCVLHISSR